MNVQERFELITEYAEELLTEERLKEYLEKDVPLRHYIGFEISGEIHLGTGIQCMSVVANLQKAGVECTLFLADYHSWINDKLGGNIEIIREMAHGYFAEGLKACLKALGGDPSKLNVVLGSDLYNKKPEFWTAFIEVCKNTSLKRILRSITIMGREEGDAVDFAKLVYPPMQVADVYALGVNIMHAGMDQRKAHVLATNVANQMKTMPLMHDGKKISPIAIHHPLLMGLGKPPVWPIEPDKIKDMLAKVKMSKSKPDTAVFVTDEPDDIKRKIKKAFCPEGEVGFNPVLDWANRMIFGLHRGPLKIERKEEHGGNLSFDTYEELTECFGKNELHPMDLKAAVSESLIELLAPVREHFEDPQRKETLNSLRKLMKQVKLR
jgi:tyrosyl-tRNA synthetase